MRRRCASSRGWPGRPRPERYPRRGGRRLTAPGVLVLAATPIGDPRDAPPRLARLLADGRRRRRRGHPPAAPAGRARSASGRPAGSSATTSTTRRPGPPSWSRPPRPGRPSRASPTPACRASPTRASGWSRAAVDAGLPRDRACPGPARCSPRSRSPGLPIRPVLLRGLPARARPASGARALEALAAEPRTMVFFEAPHRLAATLAAMADGVRRRPAGGGLPRADEDLRGGPARAAGRPGGVGRRPRGARRGHARRGRRPVPGRTDLDVDGARAAAVLDAGGRGGAAQGRGRRGRGGRGCAEAGALRGGGGRPSAAAAALTPACWPPPGVRWRTGPPTSP